MSYIGKTPTIGNFQVCDSISVVNGQAAYTMQVNSVNVVPESANHMLVSLNGILQKPGSSFTVSGSTITFASNLSTGDVIDFITILGNVLDLGVPSDDTVTAAKLNDDIISGQTELATEPADTDEFLVSDAGTIKRIDYSLIKGGGITLADQYRLTTSFTGSSQDLTSNLERVDTTGQGFIGSVTESSGIFSFSETGVYLVSFGMNFNNAADADNVTGGIRITTDNSNYNYALEAQNNAMGQGQGQAGSLFGQTLFDVTNVSTHKCKFYAGSVLSSTTIVGNSSTNNTYMTFIRLGDT